MLGRGIRRRNASDRLERPANPGAASRSEPRKSYVSRAHTNSNSLSINH